LAALAALGLGFCIGVYARFVAPKRFEVTQATVEVESWPPELDGVVIALVADMHLGRRRGKLWTSPALSKAVEAVRAAQPDLLVICGDFGFWSWDASELAEQAARFEAPERVAVLGNHDNTRGSKRASGLRSALMGHGFQVPENEVVTVKLRGRVVAIAGLGDSTSRHADPERLLAAMPRSDDPVILVCHTPDGIEHLPAGPFQLALSGHTHGGQLAIPLLQRPILERFAKTRFDRGLYNINGLPVFVTKGLGMVGHHARFRARPEVALLRIVGRAGRASQRETTVGAKTNQSM
jgi:uncharacterized protein